MHFEGVILQPKYADSVQKNEKKSFFCTEFLLFPRSNMKNEVQKVAILGRFFVGKEILTVKWDFKVMAED